VADWRITNHEKYLKGAALQWQGYASANPKNDHDHCEFCFAKFMVGGDSDVLHEGYATSDKYRWICKTYFEDFKNDFGWHVSSPLNT
jgi:hypothetical protein